MYSKLFARDRWIVIADVLILSLVVVSLLSLGKILRRGFRLVPKTVILLLLLCFLLSIIILNQQWHLGNGGRQTVHLQPRRIVKSVDCVSLFKVDEENIKKAKAQMEKSQQVVSRPPVDISTDFSCKDLIEKNSYIMDSLTPEEENFPIAYSILVFKDSQQVETLLRVIYRPQNFYCIHVDKKATETFFSEIKHISDCFPNVFLASRRIRVLWGTYTVLEPEIVCIEDLLKYKWKYFINLTGQEFPLKTNWELVKILTAYNGSNDIEGTIKRANPETWRFAGKPPHNMVPVKGAVHIIACRGFVEFAVTDPRAVDFLKWSRKVDHASEIFFSTLNHNPFLRAPGSYTGVPETGPDKPFLARFKKWVPAKCYGIIAKSICVMGVGDLPHLYNTHKLFANKFYRHFQSLTLNCLEELIQNRTAIKSNFSTDYWANLSFVRKKID